MTTGAKVAPAPFFGEAFALPRGVVGDFERCDDPDDFCPGDFALLPELDLDWDRAVSYFFFQASKRACSSGLIFRCAYGHFSAGFLRSPIRCSMHTCSFFSRGVFLAGESDLPRRGVEDPSLFFPEP